MIGQVRQLVAGGECASWALASANATAGCAARASVEQSVGVAAFGDERAPEPGADADRRGSGSGLAGPEDLSGRLVAFERDRRAGDEAH